jgi:hypothetical protein
VIGREEDPVKQHKKIQSRPNQRRKLEESLMSLMYGGKQPRKEVGELGDDEFPADGLSLMLEPDSTYSREGLCRAIRWLNAGVKGGDMRDADVGGKWSELQEYIREWRESLRVDMRNANDPYARRVAETLLTVANAWAEGDLPAVRRCMHCVEFFVAKRSNQQFCKGACRSAFYHEIETLDPEYKNRKANEAMRRRKQVKEMELRQYVRNILSRSRHMRKPQLDAVLMAAALKHKVTLTVVKEIERSLSPAKDASLLAR